MKSLWNIKVRGEGAQVEVVNARCQSTTNKLGYISCSGRARHERKGVWKGSRRMRRTGNNQYHFLTNQNPFSPAFIFSTQAFSSHILGIENKIRQERGASLDSWRIAAKLIFGIRLPFELACFIFRKSQRWFEPNPACSNNGWRNSSLPISSSNEWPFTRYVNFYLLKYYLKKITAGIKVNPQTRDSHAECGTYWISGK